MAATGENRSVTDLLSDAFNQFSGLIRSEIRLARAEITAQVSSASKGATLLAGSAVAGIATCVLLLLTIAVALIAMGFQPWVSHLLATILGLIISAALASAGIARLKATSLVPTRTMEQLELDAMAAKEQLK